MKNRFPIVVLVAIALVTGILLNQGSAGAAPAITWTPTAIQETLPAGKVKKLTVLFNASEDIREPIAIEVVPELAQMVLIDPFTLPSVSKGQTVSLTVMLAPVATVTPQVLEGTIHLRGTKNRRTYAKPLPITVEVELPQVEEDGVSFEYPNGWRVDTTARELAKTIELVNFPSWLQGGIIPPGGAAITVPVQPLPLESLQNVIGRDTKGHTVQGITDTTVGGNNAKRVESMVEFGQFSENWITVYVPHEDSLYKFILTYRSGDPRASEFIETFSHILDTAAFN